MFAQTYDSEASKANKVESACWSAHAHSMLRHHQVMLWPLSTNTNNLVDGFSKMSQISFENRVANIAAKHEKPAEKQRRGFLRSALLLLWFGFFALAAGLWHNGAISAQHIAGLLPDTPGQSSATHATRTASVSKPVSERRDGARWESVKTSSATKRAFFSLSTKGSVSTLNGGGTFTDFIEMKVDRQKIQQNSGRLGFEGQNAVADRRRDKFWQR